MSSVLPPGRSGAWVSSGVVIALVLTGLLLSVLLIGALALVIGLDLVAAISESETEGHRHVLRVYMSISQLLTFVVPGFVFLFVFEKSRWARFRPGGGWNPGSVGASLLFLVASLPIVLAVFHANQQLMEWVGITPGAESISGPVRAVLRMDHEGELLFNLLLVAVLPAVGEELIFRGLLMRFFQKALQSVHLGIWLSAMLFSFMHFQAEGFLPRMVLGLVLGYTFQWTATLFVPMILHFFNNGFQVVSIYVGRAEWSEMQIHETPQAPIWVVIVAAVSLYLTARLIKHYART
jgi:uncharacterized protein